MTTTARGAPGGRHDRVKILSPPTPSKLPSIMTSPWTSPTPRPSPVLAWSAWATSFLDDAVGCAALEIDRRPSRHRRV